MVYCCMHVNINHSIFLIIIHMILPPSIKKHSDNNSKQITNYILYYQKKVSFTPFLYINVQISCLNKIFTVWFHIWMQIRSGKMENFLILWNSKSKRMYNGVFTYFYELCHRLWVLKFFNFCLNFLGLRRKWILIK